MEQSKNRNWIAVVILAIEVICILALIAAISLIVAFPTLSIYSIEVALNIFNKYYQIISETSFVNQNYQHFFHSNPFNDVSLFAIVFLIILGLYFIRKQIKINKNRHTLLGLQNIILSYFTESYKEHAQCNKEIESILKKCLLVRNKNEINLIAQIYDTQNLGKIVENTLKQYLFKPANSNLLNSTFYELWLGKDYKKFAHIIEGQNFSTVHRFYKMYDEIITQLSKIEILYSTEESYKKIHDLVFKKIQLGLDNYQTSYEALMGEFNAFFKQLSKSKKI